MWNRVIDQTWGAYWESADKSFLERYIQLYKIRVGYKRLLNAVPEIENKGSVLEVGAGKAWISRLLRERGWFTVGVDLNSGIAILNSKAVDYYIAADMFKLPFKDKTFDLIISCGLLEHFKLDIVKEILSEMARVGKTVVTWYPICGIEWKVIWTLRNMLGGNVYSESYKHSEEKIRELFHLLNFINIKTDYVCYAGIFRYIYVYGEID